MLSTSSFENVSASFRVLAPGSAPEAAAAAAAALALRVVADGDANPDAPLLEEPSNPEAPLAIVNSVVAFVVIVVVVNDCGRNAAAATRLIAAAHDIARCSDTDTRQPPPRPQPSSPSSVCHTHTHAHTPRNFLSELPKDSSQLFFILAVNLDRCKHSRRRERRRTLQRERALKR
jgi:hypothetical protein